MDSSLIVTGVLALFPLAFLVVLFFVIIGGKSKTKTSASDKSADSSGDKN